MYEKIIEDGGAVQRAGFFRRVVSAAFSLILGLEALALQTGCTNIYGSEDTITVGGIETEIPSAQPDLGVYSIRGDQNNCAITPHGDGQGVDVHINSSVDANGQRDGIVMVLPKSDFYNINGNPAELALQFSSMSGITDVRNFVLTLGDADVRTPAEQEIAYTSEHQVSILLNDVINTARNGIIVDPAARTVRVDLSQRDIEIDYIARDSASDYVTNYALNYAAGTYTADIRARAGQETAWAYTGIAPRQSIAYADGSRLRVNLAGVPAGQTVKLALSREENGVDVSLEADITDLLGQDVRMDYLAEQGLLPANGATARAVSGGAGGSVLATLPVSTAEVTIEDMAAASYSFNVDNNYSSGYVALDIKDTGVNIEDFLSDNLVSLNYSDGSLVFNNSKCTWTKVGDYYRVKFPFKQGIMGMYPVQNINLESISIVNTAGGGTYEIGNIGLGGGSLDYRLTTPQPVNRARPFTSIGVVIDNDVQMNNIDLGITLDGAPLRAGDSIAFNNRIQTLSVVGYGVNIIYTLRTTDGSRIIKQ
ncbi:MAG: hypothetical protein LBD99_02140 [Candidatus Margulisbacteria bacterium]|jgi:hypothetical protein|nr:hypothetical protein [Candidatus Margulisiibacteriota bacterium]